MCATPLMNSTDAFLSFSPPVSMSVQYLGVCHDDDVRNVLRPLFFPPLSSSMFGCIYLLDFRESFFFFVLFSIGHF